MSIVKKQSVGGYASILAVILAVVALVMYISNANTSYYNDQNSQVILLTAAAIAAQVVLFLLARVMGEKQWLDILYIAFPVLMGVALCTFIGARVESVGIILMSDLESGNLDAINALTQAFWGFGLYLAATIVGMVGSFFKQVKE